MIFHSTPHNALASLVSLALAAVLPTAALAADTTSAAAPDLGLLTSYSLGPNYQSVNWLVCGSTQQTEGCYDLGTLGKFGQVAAMIEGAPKVSAPKVNQSTTITREIYICDVAAGSGTGVILYDYTKTDVLNGTDDAATVVLKKAIPTTLVGGANSACQMAANPYYVYVSVNGGFATVSKKLGVADGGPSEGVSSITADALGYLDVDYSDDTFYGYGPNGSLTEDGGGNYFKVGNRVATSLMNVPMFYGTFPANRTKVMPRRRSASPIATVNAAIDANLYTDYRVFSPETIDFGVCGATQQSEGCFGGGSFGPFNHAGSIMEGDKVTNGGTVTRHVYICDDAAGSGTGVTLFDYLRTDVISSSYDQTTVALVKALPLPLVGGDHANCMMAGGHANLFVGTQNGKTAVKVAESNYKIIANAGLNPSLHFATATADSRGFSATTFGTTNGKSAVNEFDHHGIPVQSTGGAYFLLNTSNAVQTTMLPTTPVAFSDSLMGVRFK